MEVRQLLLFSSFIFSRQTQNHTIDVRETQKKELEINYTIKYNMARLFFIL
jgi:hypothetical protein